MIKITWDQVKKRIDQGVTVFYINDCITVDKLTVSGTYVLIGRAGIKEHYAPEQSTSYYTK